MKEARAKSNRFRLFMAFVFVVTCGCVFSGCISSSGGDDGGLPKANKVGTAANKVPGK